MTGEDGYTTAEALAALAILGLAMAGLTTSLGLVGAGQAKSRMRVEQAVLQRTADQALDRLVAFSPPFRSDQASHLVGDADGFEVDCLEARRCGARIDNGELVVLGRDGLETRTRLPTGQAPRFVYVGSYSANKTWPPAPMPPPAPAWQTLSAVLIQSTSQTGDKPLAMARVWRQQRADCEYDVVIQDCRNAAS